MKKLFLLGVFFGLSLTLRARDSLWLLGQGTAIVTDKGEDGKPFDSRHGIAISLFDVRFKGDQRRDAVLLMMGERRLEGTVFNLFNVIDAENAMTKVIELKEAKASMFKGKIQVQLRGGKRSIHLTGQVRRNFDPTQKFVPFDATIECADMSDFDR